uniref:Uncharacterized protein n=1 Tax=Nelumbo nucifera TaxID=4432 RepID=A0A822ZIY9_NELNU|nr:TPA_asm: hypothetical protein HUJ06_002750 [Nelumbo nucifera]
MIQAMKQENPVGYGIGLENRHLEE